MYTRIELGRLLDRALTLAPHGQGVSLPRGDREEWRATLTPEGPATVHVVHVDGAVEVEAWGPGAGWAAAGGAALGGEGEERAGFRRAQHLLADLHRRHRGMPLPKARAELAALGRPIRAARE